MARVGVAVLTLVVAAAAVACLPEQASAGGADFGGLNALMASTGGSKAAAACDGAVGQCGVDEDEEMGLGSGGGGDSSDEALRRSLVRKPTNRYISYAALRADQVPCSKRGQSYYNNCGSQHQANPYKRGCSVITRCSRNMN